MIESREALFIQGGKALVGELRVNNAKNSVLYLILGALLTDEPVILEDVPRLSDVHVILEILEHFGADITWQGRDLHIHAATIKNCHAPYELVNKMRASFVAMGALLSRCGSARISMPGGCAFGPRPVDRHIKAFKDLGVRLSDDDGDFVAERIKPLAGTARFEAPTVGGTQNIILAAAIGEGQVVIENAALEPEIADLCNMLNQMGARISGMGTRTLSIQGVYRLRGIRYKPVPDRIEAGTMMMAIAATRGQATLSNVRTEHLHAIIAKLQETGVRIHEVSSDAIKVDARGKLYPENLVCDVYPQVATDVQAPFGAFLATIKGHSRVEDRVYPDRFTHVEELQRMGVDARLNDDVLYIYGGSLEGAQVHAADIRAGGALIVAALAASGTSIITGVNFIERGYEDITERLRGLGANIHKGNLDVLATGTFGS